MSGQMRQGSGSPLGNRRDRVIEPSIATRVSPAVRQAHSTFTEAGGGDGFERIVDRMKDGKENLDIISWAMQNQLPIGPVIDILAALEFAAKVTRTRSVLPTSAA